MMLIARSAERRWVFALVLVDRRVLVPFLCPGALTSRLTSETWWGWERAKERLEDRGLVFVGLSIRVELVRFA